MQRIVLNKQLIDEMGGSAECRRECTHNASPNEHIMAAVISHINEIKRLCEETEQRTILLSVKRCRIVYSHFSEYVVCVARIAFLGVTPDVCRKMYANYIPTDA